VRIVFLGTAAFACPSLRALAKIHEIALVITQPDRPAGREGELRAPPVKKEAVLLGLPVVQPEKVNAEESIRHVQAANPDVLVVAAYGQILRRSVFSLASMGTINVHASLLPRYRGAAPIQWAIIRGETETGVTTFLIDEGMDSGPLLLQRATPIDENETALELHDRLALIGAELIGETLVGLAEGTLQPLKQNEEEVSVAPRLTREDGRVDWARSAKEIHNQVRGMNPWPSAFTYLGTERIKVHRTVRTKVRCGDVQPGEIALRETGRLLVGTGDELIEIVELQRESRICISGHAFLQGLREDVCFR
jgi:methionyl-tRNA formyltransferase